MNDDAALIQRSPEWFAARCGNLGASKVADATSVLKRGGPSQAALNLMYEIAAERITGEPARRVNVLQWGIDHEESALAAYAFLTNDSVRKVGLIRHPTIEHAHASPDALVGDDGGLEIKCPTSGVHLQTLLTDAVPGEHLPQIHWSLACSGRAWWDFASFDPRFPADQQLFVKRIKRDEAVIAKIEQDARAFLAEVDAAVNKLLGSYRADAATVPHRTWSELTPTQQAGIRCKEPAFWRFLGEHVGRFGGRAVSSADDAADIVRAQCDVASRKDILPGTPAEPRWRLIESAYQAWRTEAQVVGLDHGSER